MNRRPRQSRLVGKQERITIVRTLDDYSRVVAVRAIAYIDGQDCPFDEEFDGNDFCAMHLIGWLGDEPAACLRVRFFSDFVKLERLAVRPDCRGSTLAFRLVRHALRLSARKGYRYAYGHAQSGLEDFWSRFGARPIGELGAFEFSGRRYTEMMVELPAHNEAIRIGADPLVIIRPEGEWDKPGILEPKPATEPVEAAESATELVMSGDLAPEAATLATPESQPDGTSTAEIATPADDAAVPERWTADLQAAWRAFFEPQPSAQQHAA
jgi:predicted GNAT family N-acyltransferase